MKPQYIRADLAGHMWSPEYLQRATNIVPEDGEFLSDGLRGFGDAAGVTPCVDERFDSGYKSGVVTGMGLGAALTAGIIWVLIGRKS